MRRQIPVLDPTYRAILRERKRQARLGQFWGCLLLIAFLLFVLLLITVAVQIRDAVGPGYGEIVVLGIAAVLSLSTAGVWSAARGYKAAAWRFMLAAASIACTVYAWYSLPSTQYNRLLKAAVAASVRLQNIQIANPSPATPSAKKWVLTHEREAVRRQLEWECENKLRRADPSREHARGESIVLFTLAGFLAAMCIVGPKIVLDSEDQ
jgi:hypothetical protein